MLEVLVTILILAFGMLGLAGLQSKIFSAEMESYQRAQAVVLMNDMVERLNANRDAAASYVPSVLGTTILGPASDGQPAPPNPCPTASATSADIVARDQCEWSQALKGVAETSGSQSVGGMIGAIGCIKQLQAQQTTPTCVPGIYLVSVAWQGLNATSIPSVGCGQGSFGGDDRFRRAISTRVAIGLPTCQ